MEPATWVALIAALAGGSVVKIIEHFLNKRPHQESVETQLREELRQDRERYRGEVEKAEAEADKWRDRYYKLQEERELRNAADTGL